jgi:O-antigen ligase
VFVVTHLRGGEMGCPARRPVGFAEPTVEGGGVFGHPVVDQTIHKHGLDWVAAVVYACAFVLVAIVTRRRPAFGVAALIVVDPFALYRDVGETTLTLPKVALVALIAGLFSRADARRLLLDALGSRRARPLLLSAAFVAFCTALSIVQAEHRLAAIRETLKALEYLVLFVCVLVAMRVDPREEVARIAITATLGVVTLMALSQEVLGAPSGFWFFNHPIPRIAGPLEGPNQLSGYLGIMLPIVAAFALLRRPSRAEVAVLGLGSMALVLTLSRAGTAAALLALALVVFLAPSARRRVVVGTLLIGAGAGLFVLALYGSTSLLARFSSVAEVERSGGVGTRGQLWHAALALWRQHPWLGIGAGNFELEISRVGPAGIRTHANSLYLQALVEGGAPLLVATLVSVAASILTFARGPLREPLVLGALAASAGLAAHQVFDLLVFYPKVGGMWWIVLGLGVAQLATASRRGVPAREFGARALAGSRSRVGRRAWR